MSTGEKAPHGPPTSSDPAAPVGPAAAATQSAPMPNAQTRTIEVIDLTCQDEEDEEKSHSLAQRWQVTPPSTTTTTGAPRPMGHFATTNPGPSVLRNGAPMSASFTMYRGPGASSIDYTTSLTSLDLLDDLITSSSFVNAPLDPPFSPPALGTSILTTLEQDRCKSEPEWHAASPDGRCAKR